jgi:hypothetical protein
LLVIKRFCTVYLSNYRVLGIKLDLELLREGFLVNEVAHANTRACHLVHITGTDAALGSADFFLAESGLLQLVQPGVIRSTTCARSLIRSLLMSTPFPLFHGFPAAQRPVMTTPLPANQVLPV